MSSLKTKYSFEEYLIVVEIVSPGNPEDDYRYKRCSAVLGVSPMSDCIKKRSEYAVREIPEYWVVDPQELKVSVFLLIDGFYEVTEYTKQKTIISQTFPKLYLTANEIFSA